METTENHLSDVMTERPMSLDPDELADVAMALMHSCRFRHLPVVQHGKLLGVLSLLDLLGAPSLRVRISELMTHPAPVAAPTTTVRSAIERMVCENLTCLMVVDGDALVGVVTRTDLLSCASDMLRAGEPPGRECPVSRLMTHPPIRTIGVTDPVLIACQLMKQQGIRHLPVMSGERLVGMLSDYDLLASHGQRLPFENEINLSARLGDPLVGDLMSKKVLTVHPDDSALHAAELLYRRRIGALPVVTHGRLCGLLSVTDYFHYLVNCGPSAASHGAGEHADHAA
jgi:CBS domain-containing membrane protein